MRPHARSSQNANCRKTLVFIETKSTFLNHLAFIMVTITAFALIFLSAIMSSDSFDVTNPEMKFLTNMGRDTEQVTRLATSAYNVAFESTPANVAIDYVFHKNDRFENEGAGILAGVDWARKYADNFTCMIYRGIWRLIALWPIYLTGIITFCIPAMIDGLVLRAKRKYDFLQSNPAFFYGAMHFVSLTIGLVFLIPIVIDTTMIAGLLLLVASSFWAVAANF